MTKLIILRLIHLYQKTLSPDTGWFAYKYPYGFCRFYPHCSAYSCQAIEKYGVLKGGILSIKRVFRCHPFSRGGNDPI